MGFYALGRLRDLLERMEKLLNMFAVFGILKNVFIQVCSDKRIYFQLLMSMLILLGGIIANILMPILLKLIIDNFTMDSRKLISFLLLGYGFIWMFGHASVHLREILLHRAEERTSQILGSQLLAHLFQLSPKFHLEQKTSVLLSIVRRSQSTVVLLIWSLLFHLIPVFLEILITLIILTRNYPLRYIAIIAVSFVVFVIYSCVSTKTALSIRAKAIEIDQKTEANVTDWLYNYETVRVSGKIQEAIDFCHSSLQEKEVSEASSLIKLDTIRIGQAIILGLSVSILSYVTGHAVVTNQLTTGDFVLFNGYFLQFIAPLSIIGYVFRDIEKSLLELEKGLSILRLEPDIRTPTHPIIVEAEPYKLEFRNVSFKYADREILKDVSFTVHANQTILISGKTGSGKTTISKLILRLFDVDRGCILINDIDIRRLDLNYLYRNIGYMAQDAGLFNASIENNIRFSNPDATQTDLEEAVKAANLTDFITSQAQGYDAVVGEKGVKLSGGEKQRILLARIFLARPKICIFDEPTSAIDRENSIILMGNIQKYFEKSIKVIITHKPIELKNIDQHIHLDNGNVQYVL